MCSLTNNVDAGMLRGLFTYKPDTGMLLHKVDAPTDVPGPKHRAGDLVGTPDSRGYIIYNLPSRITGRRVRVSVHRVIWYMVYGDIPDDMQIDHINQDKGDNRLVNLRAVTQSQNLCNKQVAHYKGREPSSIYKGVHRSTNGYWLSSVRPARTTGSKLHLGNYTCEKSAAFAFALYQFHTNSTQPDYVWSILDVPDECLELDKVYRNKHIQLLDISNSLPIGDLT
jgi:hypothetical protein